MTCRRTAPACPTDRWSAVVPCWARTGDLGWGPLGDGRPAAGRLGAGRLGAVSLLAAVVALAPMVVQAEDSSKTKWFDGSMAARDSRDQRTRTEHLDLLLRLDPEAGRVEGTATYRIRRREGAPPPVLDAVGLQRSSAVWLAGASDRAPVQAVVEDGDGTWQVAWPPSQASVLLLRVQWQVQPRRGMYVVRPDRDAPDRPLHLWTQGEADETRYWLPSPDDPDERLTWTVSIDAPAQTAAGGPPLVALSNGDPRGRSEQGGRAVTTFASPWPLPIYLLSVAVGPFQLVEHRGGTVPLQSWLLPADVADGRRAFAQLPQIFDALQRWLGVPYPFSRYGQVVVHEFHFGGMENASLTTLAHRNLPNARAELDHRADGLLAHELAHQWFGDLVTCRTWGELWLNEGFASYLTAVADELLLGHDRFAEQLAQMREGYLRESQEKMRPLSLDRFDSPDGMFDGHAYSKGAWVAQMLRQRLGDQVFRKGLAGYLGQHRMQSVDRHDLRRALEAASGQSLRSFFRRWVEEPGHPQLAVSVRWDGAAKQLQLAIEQKQKVAHGLPSFDVPIDVLVRSEAGKPGTLHRLRLDRQRREWTLPLASRPAVVEVDPQMALLADWSVEAAPEDLAAMATSASSPDVRWRAVRDLARQPSHPVHLAALRTAVARDAARHVRQEAATALGKAARQEAAATLAGVLRSGEAEPGVRAAAAAALGELRADEGWEALAAAAERDPSHNVQRAALTALVAIDRVKARSLLLQAVQWPSFRDRVQVAALQGLAVIGQHRDWPVILAAAVPGKPKTLREGAAVAVGQFAARVYTCRDDARRLLEQMLHDDSAALRGAAIRGLEAMGDAAALPALQAVAARSADPRQADQARKAIAGIRQQAPLEERLLLLERELQQLQRDTRPAGIDGKGVR